MVAALLVEAEEVHLLVALMGEGEQAGSSEVVVVGVRRHRLRSGSVWPSHFSTSVDSEGVVCTNIVAAPG